MSTAVVETDVAIGEEYFSPTVADLLERIQQFDDIPFSRILVHPLPGTATEDDVVRLADAPNRRLCELVDGTLVEKAMGYLESAIAMQLGSLITAFVKEHKLGLVVGERRPR